MRTPEEKYKMAVKMLKHLLRKEAVSCKYEYYKQIYFEEMELAGDLLDDLEQLEFSDLKDKLTCLCALW